MISNKFLLSLFTLTISSQAYGYTLDESYKNALINFQTDNLSDSRIEQSVEAEKQVKGSYLPKVNVQGTYLKQDQFDDQKTVGINLKTNLYNGGRDKQAIENAERSIEIAKNLKEFDRIKIFQDVVNSYYNYVLAMNDLKNITLLEKQSNDRAVEIQKRVDIGRSRRGELLQAQAQLASVEANKRNAQGLVNQYAAVFYKLTGLGHKEIIDFDIPKTSNAKDLNTYVELALKREDVLNKELEVKNAQGVYKITSSHFRPSLDLNSNAYGLKEGGSSTSRNSDWDVGLSLTIPLFEGGISNAKKKEQYAKMLSAQYEETNLKKNVEIEIARNYEQFNRYKEQIKAYEKALDRSKKSYEESLKDYRLGLITNLDVITSMNLYLDNKKEFEKTQILAHHNLKLLEASAGMIP